MKSQFIDKLIERINKIGPQEVRQYLLHLAREKGFLETVFNALQEGVIVTDAEGRITYLNQAACDFFALDPEQGVGALISDKIRGLEWTALISGEGVVSRDLEVFYPENRYLNFYIVPVTLDAFPVGEKTTTHDQMGYAMIVRDETESRRTAEETLESERLSAVTLLAAGVAHEIGNPLNSLNIHLQLAERKIRRLPKDQQGELVDSIRIAKDEIKRLDFIITQFLRAIRPSQPETAPENLNKLIEESLEFLQGEIADRDILVETELRSNLPRLRVDRNQIKQAFYNLVKNACQAMNAGGILRISTTSDGEFVSVSFGDTGSGITAENMTKLFQPYFTTKESGSGLGLLIVRRIIREHGGEIKIDSHQGRGTTVTLRLPLSERQVRLLEAGDTARETSEPPKETHG